MGKLSIWKLRDLFIPTKNVAPTNGAHYPEVEMYMGIAILFIWQVSWWWIPLFVSIMVLVGLFPSIQRIPARSLVLLTMSMAILGTSGLEMNKPYYYVLLLLQAFLLLRNSSIYPSFPFSQWWKKPSELYHKFKADGAWPNVTGYLFGNRISSYQGAFRMKEPLWTN